jgi:hypothetical protein
MSTPPCSGWTRTRDGVRLRATSACWFSASTPAAAPSSMRAHWVGPRGGSARRSVRVGCGHGSSTTKRRPSPSPTGQARSRFGWSIAARAATASRSRRLAARVGSLGSRATTASRSRPFRVDRTRILPGPRKPGESGGAVTSPRVVKGHDVRLGRLRTRLRRGRRFVDWGRRLVHRGRRCRGRTGARGTKDIGIGRRRCAPWALAPGRLDGRHRRGGGRWGGHGCPPARRKRRQLRRTPQPWRFGAWSFHHRNRTRADFAGALPAWTGHRITDCPRAQANPDQEESYRGQATGHGAIRLVRGHTQPSARCGRRFCLSLKRVNFPMLSPRWTSTSRTTPAGNSRLRASNRTGVRPTTFFLRLTGHPRPTQRTTAFAPLGAWTVSRRISVPSAVTLPTSLTIGNGLNILGSGIGPTSGGPDGPAAPAGGCARTETVSDSVEAAPLSSVTRRLTVLWPAVENLRVTRGPVASSKSPSPSMSQAWSVMRPSRSSELGDERHFFAHERRSRQGRKGCGGSLVGRRWRRWRWRRRRWRKRGGLDGDRLRHPVAAARAVPDTKDHRPVACRRSGRGDSAAPGRRAGLQSELAVKIPGDPRDPRGRIRRSRGGRERDLGTGHNGLGRPIEVGGGLGDRNSRSERGHDRADCRQAGSEQKPDVTYTHPTDQRPGGQAACERAKSRRCGRDRRTDAA